VSPTTLQAAERSGAPPPLSDRQLEIETPEQVPVGYELAGPGSRFAAFLLDAAILGFTLLLILPFAFLLVMDAALGGVLQLGAAWILALTIVAVFVIVWGYFILFEGLRDGQTPGKRWMGLRVIHANGFPLTLAGSAIRNLLRILDLQPLPTGLLGGSFILFHPRAQRPGDLAAGTVVIRERPRGQIPEETAAEGPPELSDDEYEVLRAWALKHHTLEKGARRRIGGRLHRQLQRAVPEGPTEAALRELYARESGRRTARGTGTGSGSPSAAALLRRQRPRWEAWRTLLERARRRGLPALPESDVAEFAALYREVTADLARARTYGASSALLSNLEESVGQGHNLLYSAPPRTFARIREWILEGVPRLIRLRWRPMALATLLFFGPALVTFGAIMMEPDRAERVVPAALLARAEAAEELRAQGIGYGEAVIAEETMPIAAASILTNNVQVTFFAFAGGLLLGLGTVVILVLNGVLLGGVAAAFQLQGQSMHLWAFVLPHGVIELTAICLAGGAGMWIGSALVLPGRRTRGQALVERSRDAVSVLGGVVVLLVIAGVIEGFISPSPALSEWTKVGFGIFTGLALFPWLLLSGAGRGRRSEEEEEEARPTGDRAVRRRQSSPRRLTSV
jgi:uncharacterized membrane protein SpoIIM required for sporulation/uncharacterized RDD family membrane protein YckC